jgi:hypothetical protein
MPQYLDLERSERRSLPAAPVLSMVRRVWLPISAVGASLPYKRRLRLHNIAYLVLCAPRLLGNAPLSLRVPATAPPLRLLSFCSSAFAPSPDSPLALPLLMCPRRIKSLSRTSHDADTDALRLQLLTSTSYFSAHAMLALATLFLLAGLAAALNHKIQVAPGGALVYQPPNIVADVGDTVSFIFTNKNLYVCLPPHLPAC